MGSFLKTGQPASARVTTSRVSLLRSGLAAMRMIASRAALRYGSAMGALGAISTHDAAVLVAVVGARLIIPLLIFRYPLPAILAAMVIDAADQSIFQQATSLDLTGYQSYDKALDVYYLSLAYLSMMRNWVSRDGFDVGRFLYYYRLVGVVLFEQTQIRALLLVTEIRIRAEQKGILSVETESSRLKCLRNSGRRDDWVQLGTRFPRLTAPKPLLRLREIVTFLNNLPNP
jgi:hypothetical protein